MFRLEHGLMQLHGADEQNVPRGQKIAAAFDDIADIAREEKIDLVEIVVVQRHFLEIGIFVKEYLIGVRAHILAGFKMLGFDGHDLPPFPKNIRVSAGMGVYSFSTAYSNFYNVSSNFYNEVCKKLCYHGLYQQKGLSAR